MSLGFDRTTTIRTSPEIRAELKALAAHERVAAGAVIRRLIRLEAERVLVRREVDQTEPSGAMDGSLISALVAGEGEGQ